MMRTASLKARLYVIVALCIFGLVAFAMANFYTARQGALSLSKVYEAEVVPMVALVDMERALDDIRFRLAGYILDQLPAVGNRNHLKEVEPQIPKAWTGFKEQIKLKTVSEQEARLIARIDGNMHRLAPFLQELNRAYEEDDKQTATRLLEDNWPLDIHAPLLKPISQLVPFQEAAVQQTYERHHRLTQRIISLGLLALGVGVVMLATLVASTANGIVRKLALAVHTANKTAAGDWSGDIDTSGRDEVGQLLRAIAEMRDQVHLREERLENAQNRLATILDNTAEGIIMFDAAGKIVSTNRATERLFGYRAEDLQDKTIAFLIPPDRLDSREGYLEHFMRTEIQRLVGEEGEVFGRRADGSRFPMAIKVRSLILDGQQMYTAMLADISERKAAMERLKYMAERDGLTGLYNRSFFLGELERLVDRARRGKNQGALLYIDLDNFKYVNDALGHAAGDRVLVEVAAALNKRARKSDLIARMGGDEFIVLLYNVDQEQAAAVAESFRKTLEDYQFQHATERVDIGCSIGVGLIDENTRSTNEALAHADVACHFAKREGRNRVHLFNNADAENLTDMSIDMGWSRRIKDAIEHDRLVLAFQAIIHARSEMVAGYEVLVRMLDSNGDLIMPGAFFPAAERFGLAVDIDKWVIVHALAQLAEGRQSDLSLSYSINLAAQTLTRLEVCDLIEERLRFLAIDPAAVTFEVTETSAITDMAAATAFLGRLKEIGCKTALDDFGSGMSSFGYLQTLPIDLVKIDGRFVRKMVQDPIDQAMVKSMNEIAHALGKKTVAEYVEDESILRLLVEFGADYAQGFHIGKPDIHASPSPRTP